METRHFRIVIACVIGELCVRVHDIVLDRRQEIAAHQNVIQHLRVTLEHEGVALVGGVERGEMRGSHRLGDDGLSALLSEHFDQLLFGALCGAVLIQEIVTSTTFLQIGTEWQYYLPGILILAGAGIYSRTRNRQPQAVGTEPALAPN